MKSILIIHGWNYRNYHNKTQKDAWDDRIKFVKELEKDFNVIRFDLPGFGTNPSPKQKMWTLEDYTRYVQEYVENNKIKPDFILGYSFGGAIAIKLKQIYKRQEKIILVSPAIIRNSKKSKSFKKTPPVLNSLRNFVRNMYVIYKMKTPEMVYGDKFLRNSYQSIVREDLSKSLQSISSEDLCIIYGEKDTMVEPIKLHGIVKSSHKKRINFIKSGGHDIGNTHPTEIIKIFKDNFKISLKSPKSTKKKATVKKKINYSTIIKKVVPPEKAKRR